MIHLDTEKLFPENTEVSIALHTIEAIAASRPAKSPSTCHIPAAITFIESLAGAYREHVRFWEDLIVVIRNKDSLSHKRARLRGLARRHGISYEEIQNIAANLTIKQMGDEADGAKAQASGYLEIAHDFADAGDSTKFLKFAIERLELSSQALDYFQRIQRTMRAQTSRYSLSPSKARERIDAEYDTSYLENQIWFWALVADVLREMVLQQAMDESAYLT